MRSMGGSEEPRPAAITSPGGEKNIRPTQSGSSPSELLFIQIKGPVPRTTHPLLLKAQPLFKWLARAADAVISGFGGCELETDEGKHGFMFGFYMLLWKNRFKP